MATDTQILDFLDNIRVPSGMGWKFRRSSTGRGWRLLTTTEQPNYPTAREAMRAVILEAVGDMTSKVAL